MNRISKSIIFIFGIVGFINCDNNRTTVFTFKCDNSGKIWISAKLNKEIETEFMFDTGAATSVINEKTFNNLSIDSSKDSSYVWFGFYDAQPLLLSNTFPMVFSLGDLETSDNISFQIIPDSLRRYQIIGMDIIDLFYWYFDFNKMQVKVSAKPQRIRKRDFIKISYYNIYDNHIYCDLNLFGKVIIDSIFIDTGFGKGVAGNTTFGFHLQLPSDSPSLDSLSKYFSPFEIGDAEPDKPNVPDMLFPFEESSSHNRIIYTGFVASNREHKKTYSATRRLFNGILTIAYTNSFCALYFDTKNQIIYIKPTKIIH